MLLKKHKHLFLFTKDEMVQERVDDDTGEAQISRPPAAC